MTNDTVTLGIIAGPVPSDRECVKNLSQILQGVADLCMIGGLASGTSGAPGVVPTNNIAAQALALAQANQKAISDLAAKLPIFRSSTTPIALAGTGDRTVPVTFTDVGTTNYVVAVTLFGPATYAATFYGWAIVSSSRTSNSFLIRFDNPPVGASFTWALQTEVNN